MKFHSVLRFALFPSISCICNGASLLFPVNGVTNGDPLDGTWTQSDGVLASDLLAFYSTTAGSPVYEGVGVGAYVDDYADITDGNFMVGHSTDAVAVGGASIDWAFSITSPSGDFSTSLNDYFINILDTTSANVLTITLINIDPTQWQAFANGVSMGFISPDGLYDLHASFGATSGYYVSIVGSGNTTIFTENTLFDPTGKTFGTVQVGTDIGGEGDFGDGFISVVPEPGSSLLISMLPAFFVLRRRR